MEVHVVVRDLHHFGNRDETLVSLPREAWVIPISLHILIKQLHIQLKELGVDLQQNLSQVIFILNGLQDLVPGIIKNHRVGEYNPFAELVHLRLYGILIDLQLCVNILFLQYLPIQKTDEVAHEVFGVEDVDDALEPLSDFEGILGEGERVEVF